MVVQSLGGQLLGGMFATIFLYISDLPMSHYENKWQNDEVFCIELFCGFFVSLAYYLTVIDMRSQHEFIYPFVMACMYSAIAVALPSFCAGNIIRLFTGLNTDVAFILSSVAGQLIGTLGGALFYKFALCENEEMQSMVRAVNENETKGMDF